MELYAIIFMYALFFGGREIVTAEGNIIEIINAFRPTKAMAHRTQDLPGACMPPHVNKL